MKKTLLVLSMSAAVLFGCKKEEKPKDTPAAPLTRSQMLSLHDWLLMDSGVDSNQDSILQPGESFKQDCNSDDYASYASNGIYTFSPGVVKCSGTDNTKSGTWKLYGDHYIVTSTTAQDTAYIYSLDEESLIVFGLPGNPYMQIYKRK